MKAFLKEGIVCVQVDGNTIIFDTGSPVTLGDGSIIDLDEISIKTHTSIMGYSWQSIKQQLPFNAVALVGTDQINNSAICINLIQKSFNWMKPLLSGTSFEMIAGVPVISVVLNEKVGRFFLDTGASICYVTNKNFVDECNSAGEFEDFHPILGAFSTRLYSSDLIMCDQQIEVKVGMLPSELSFMLRAVDVDGIIGTNSLLDGELNIDLTNRLYNFSKVVESIPHDNWANSYDQLFEASFGDLLRAITNLTKELVLELSAPPETILDIGAGTGRMCAPLLDCNFNVTALDPSRSMLDQLEKKFPDHPNLELINSPIAELDIAESFNGALCVFTVSSYWLDENTLSESLSAIYDALLPKGWLIIDRTHLSSFANTEFQTKKVQRQAIVENLEDDIYRFTEKSKVTSDTGNIEEVDDSFLIRFWEEDLFLKHVRSVGFKLERNLSGEFGGSGASFYLLRK